VSGPVSVPVSPVGGPASDLGPVTLAAMLGRPRPTDEQQAVIAAPLAPSVVVAGAGSGKTETMAARVLWLIANGHVRPDEVLGLTFTRKAAGELAGRVRQRLSALASTGRVQVPDGEPTVATYDSFAGQVVAEHGARLGVEPGRGLLTPAGSWQRASRLVARWDGPMDDVDYAPATVVDDLLGLHGQVAAHVTDLAAVGETTQQLLGVIDATPPSPRQRKALHSKLVGVRRAQVARLRLLPLVAEYRARLAADSLTDFATVAEQAARVATAVADVGAAVRAQYRVVLLDEFQDTSYAQLDLLLALFGAGHAVTAVGDPCQSIYAWRGANADTLAAFEQRFAADRPVARYALRTSFRNERTVLEVANVLAEPLRSDDDHVETLVCAPGAMPGEVRAALHRTRAEQAVALAEQVASRWYGAAAPERPSIGVLVRKRDEIPAIEAELRARDIPVEVVGLDGLLQIPEVVDVVSLLQVAADPARGDALVRLLTGPVLRFGARDLHGLARWARHRTRDVRAREMPWQVPDVGIAECLQHPPPRGWISARAAERLATARRWVAAVRSRVHRPLPELVADAVAVLGLDTETSARAHRTGAAGSSHLDRLVDEAAAFAEVAGHAGLAEFLDYLVAGEEQERGLRRAADVHLGSRVQLLTVHAAKGLEWDVVAVAGMSDGGFPTRSRVGGAWLTDPGTLPYPLRGDGAALPALDTVGVDDQSDLAVRVDAVYAAGRDEHLAEERRLAYVAVTRARTALVCHGYRWGDGQRPLDPSPFLVELAEHPDVVVEVWADDPGPAPDPSLDAPRWPVDPLGRHRPAIQAGAEHVRAALEQSQPRRDGLAGRAADWDEEVSLLLAERDAEQTRARQVLLPSHLTATTLVLASSDPEQTLSTMRRPMPSRPRVHARRGTAFHAWVEQYYGRPGLLDIDELPGSADAAAPSPSADLDDLREAFLASAWAARQPMAVEAPFEMVVDDTVVRGRADAVFADGDGIVVVDWKTGPPPRTGAEAAQRSTQLAVYRAAFAALHGLDPSRVRAVFHHIAENVTVEQSADVDVGDVVRTLRRQVAATP
jgi:DNA helicase-2/ATP-dependent DNA helicase PcrA